MADKQTFFMDKDGGFLLAVPGLKARPVPVWETGEDGRRKPTDKQEIDRETGLPLWEQDCILQGISYGQPSAQMVTVRYPSKDDQMPRPKSAAFFGESAGEQK